MPRLTWTPPTLADLESIRSYFGDRNPGVGVQILTAVRAKARLLQQFPAAGPVFDGALRTMTVLGTRYSLDYRVTEDAIQILRVRHEREDWR